MDGASDASEGGAAACVEHIVIEPRVVGSYTYSLLEPATSLEHDYSFPREDLRIKPDISYYLMLPHPFFAAAFSADELCSAEASSPSSLRLVCLGREARPVTIDYRIEGEGRIVVIEAEGKKPIRATNDKLPPGVCWALATKFQKRDLAALQKAYLNDSPSPRCQSSSAPRRKVTAKMVRRFLDKTDEYPELGVLRRADVCGMDRLCRDYTHVQLALPPSMGGVQELSILGGQCCEPCEAQRFRLPNGIKVTCNEGFQVEAYQLGDHLYLVNDARVRRVPLPCGVELDYDLKEFLAGLRDGTEIRVKEAAVAP